MKKKIPCKLWIQKESNQKKIEMLKRFSNVMSDPNKVRIIMLLDQYNQDPDQSAKVSEYENLYVSDLSEHLGMSVSAVSHSLKQLLLLGFIHKERMGRQAIYNVTDYGRSLLKTADLLTSSIT